MINLEDQPQVIEKKSESFVTAEDNDNKEQDSVPLEVPVIE